MRKSTWIGVAALTAMLALTGAASAITLELLGPLPGHTLGPQSSSNPCIIAGTNCQQPAVMGYNNFTSNGNISSYNMFSTTPTATVADGVQGTPYTVGQLETALNNAAFVIAIDVNTTGAEGETLQLFEIIVNGAVLYNYVGPTVIGDVNANGNGYADWALGIVGGIDLSGFADSATVLFHAVWNNASDGPESFFLIPVLSGTPFSVVPGPALGAGLPALVAACGFLLAFARRRRQLTA